MLASRIIPTILNKSGSLVKGEGFKCDRVVGHAMQAARIHAMRGVDELMILYVDPDQEMPDYESIACLRVAQSKHLPTPQYPSHSA